MNGSFFPNDVDYKIINTQLFNNPSIVQFLHRLQLIYFYFLLYFELFFYKK